MEYGWVFVVLHSLAFLQEVFLVNIQFETTPLTWGALDTWTELQEHSAYKITGNPRPIYRQDLPADYIAYWELEVNDTDYVILSSSAKTGDYRFNQQGPLPSPTTLLDKYASLIKCQCHRYYMLSPDGQMYCQDEEDRIVAMTTERLLESDWKDASMKMSKMETIVREQQTGVRRMWKQRRGKVIQSDVWSTITVLGRGQTLSRDERYSQQAVSPGEKLKIPLNNATDTVKVTFLPFNANMSDMEKSAWQRKLCSALGDICTGEYFTYVNEGNFTIFNEYGGRVLILQLHEDGQHLWKLLEGTDIGFQVEIHHNNGETVLKRFGIDLGSENHRTRIVKRFTKRLPWHTTMSQITHEELFPNYWQHRMDGCRSGSGSVAWAMIFGYYDRLAHLNESYGFSQALWRCGEDATDGSDDCVAPPTQNATVQLYVESIRRKLGTFCLLGSITPHWKMDHVKRFYRRRQGSTAFISTYNSGNLQASLGWYGDNVSNNIIKILGTQLPAIVGYRVGALRHYAVTTKLRRRHRRYRHCFLICTDWKKELDNDIYIHFGDENGDGNGWRSCEGYFAAVAYPHSIQT
ncbi:uncharacterized protein LOC102807618 [Saccoglossus kowalevskii]|uniref:Uncharacterized protein LOC102807618 n=1 Tax=Saccoglossus kowalevskii TaxID=10224 RepID=A0ABM0MBN1_SACKO|nr:PREDICTED: uncharacterized protein LOC102807618 [Saccoglossus kowalevskii]